MASSGHDYEQHHDPQPRLVRLRVRAAEHGHSMEAEARRILQTTLAQSERAAGRPLYERVRERFEALGGADDVVVAPRLPDRDPPRLD